MPISGTYTYSQTESEIVLAVPLKGVSPRSVDVLLAKNLVKVNYAPFLIDLNLAHDVDDTNSKKAVLKDGVLYITLEKLEDGIWGDLLFEGDKDAIAERREQALNERMERMQRLHEESKNRKAEEERMTLRKQMDLEENERQMIEDKKAEEKQAAEKELYKALVEMEKAKKEKNEADIVADTAVPATSDEKDKGGSFTAALLPAEAESSNINRTDEQEENNAAAVNDTNVVSLSAEAASRSIPPVRKTARTTFMHTPRLFQTPSRESTVKQEQEFIMKNRSHLNNNRMLDNKNDAVDIVDADPVWLCQRGNDFLASKDYLSAINAYSSALEAEADPTMVQALANRGACYQRIGEAEKCIADCERALGMESAEKPLSNQQEQEDRTSKLLVCIGKAKCQQGLYAEGLTRLEHAKSMSTRSSAPDDETLERDIQLVKIMIEATAFKEDADQSFKDGDSATALALYDKAAALAPEFITNIANRTACHLAMKNYSACKADCTAALNLLQNNASTATAFDGSVPPLSSETKKKLEVALLCRRSMAKHHLLEHQGSIDDKWNAKQLLGPEDKEAKKELDREIACVEQEIEGFNEMTVDYALSCM